MKVILDMDLGIDDAVALAYAVGCDDIEIVGVTGTYGNVYVGQGARNTRAVLELLGVRDVPVVAGLPHALEKDRFDRLEVSSRIHGRDGLGGVGQRWFGVVDCDSEETEDDGVGFLLEAARRYGKELTIISTGPLTNVASALRRDRKAMLETAGLVMMGGALTVTGNVNEAAEANVYQDPRACKEVLESGMSVAMVGLDVTSCAFFTREDTARWRLLETPAGHAFADMLDHYIDEHRDIEGMEGRCYIHDPSAVACAVHPELFEMLRLPLTCIDEGPLCGKVTCLNERVSHRGQATTRACVDVDAQGLEAELRATLETVLGGARQA